MKIIIAGGRDYQNYNFVKKTIDKICAQFNIVKPEIVSGGCRGADQLGERYAYEKGLTIASFHADWDQFGKLAGTIRNEQMAEYADFLIAFWDGKSKGTKDMIKKAKYKKLKIIIKTYYKD